MGMPSGAGRLEIVLQRKSAYIPWGFDRSPVMIEDSGFGGILSRA